MNRQDTWEILARTRNHLDDWVGDYLGQLSLQRLPDGTTRIKGTLPDTPALYGFILRLRDGGIPLLSLHVERRAEMHTETRAEQNLSQEEETQ
ncbi:MAG: hypothetical protein EA427_15355 [Spirochaetaceae bacterium]|nr:MAG: hypothetical protein EA427_15355 [Spirochaetaceae bacterium]